MNFTVPKRAGEKRRLSKPSERLNMARSLVRPRLLEAGLVDAAAFNRGHADGLASRKWALTETDLLTAGDVANLSYMLGFRAGELERRSGVNATELAGRRED